MGTMTHKYQLSFRERKRVLQPFLMVQLGTNKVVVDGNIFEDAFFGKAEKGVTFKVPWVVKRTGKWSEIATKFRINQQRFPY